MLSGSGSAAPGMRIRYFSIRSELCINLSNETHSGQWKNKMSRKNRGGSRRAQPVELIPVDLDQSQFFLRSDVLQPVCLPGQIFDQR
jgi:hypothetical protein